MRIVLLGLVLIFAVAGWLRAAESWMQFRGPGGQGVSAEKSLPTTWSATQNIAWKTPLPGPGTSSPILVGDKIYLTCYSGYNVPGQPGDMNDLKRHLVCLNRANGQLLWKNDVAASLPEQDRIRDDHGYASSTPASDGQAIYCFFGKSGAYAFDLAGKQKWHADLGDEIHDWGSAASPVLFENLLIVNASVESGTLYALEKATGKEVWQVEDVRESWNTPVLAKTAGGKTELLVAEMGQVLGIDPKTGTQLWSCETRIPWYMVPSTVVDGGVSYWIGGRSGAAFAIRLGGRGDVSDSHRVWTGTTNSNVPSPLVHGGHMYWANDNQGIVYCADSATGKIVYQERLPRADQVYASPILADGKIYYLTRSGKTFVVAASPEFKLLATNDLRSASGGGLRSGDERGMFNACPVVADGRLLIRSDKYLYCIDEK
ncbi:MAG: PQQ-like beta-propeller repeat protein [Planctomycetaceae bacterium]|nr:PQQ-like beta-propeller repeat protein [Planctomycetaceae bacterium]